MTFMQYLSTTVYRYYTKFQQTLSPVLIQTQSAIKLTVDFRNPRTNTEVDLRNPRTLTSVDLRNPRTQTSIDFESIQVIT